jgi:hypothetical protein
MLKVFQSFGKHCSCHIHPEEDKCSGCRNAGTLSAFGTAHPRKPKLYKVQFYFSVSRSFADRSSPLIKSVTAGNSVHDSVQRYRKGSAFHKLQCFTFYSKHLLLLHFMLTVSNKPHSVLHLISRVAYIKLPKLKVGGIINRFTYIHTSLLHSMDP